MSKSSNKVRPNSLYKPLIGQIFHKVDHVSWSKHCNLHWIHFVAVVVKICGCHPHPSFTFLHGRLLGNHIWCHMCVITYLCLHDLDVHALYVIHWIYEMDVWWKFYGSKFKLLIHPHPLAISEVYLSYCNSNRKLMDN